MAPSTQLEPCRSSSFVLEGLCRGKPLYYYRPGARWAVSPDVMGRNALLQNFEMKTAVEDDQHRKSSEVTSLNEAISSL